MNQKKIYLFVVKISHKKTGKDFIHAESKVFHFIGLSSLSYNYVTAVTTTEQSRVRLTKNILIFFPCITPLHRQTAQRLLHNLFLVVCPH